MPELETVAIVSWKDPTQMWRINKADYDPEQHTLWEMHHAESQTQAPEAQAETTAEAAYAVDFDEVELPAAEPASDFVTDATGAVTEMVIVDPGDKRARKVIPAADYDPDAHVLWSERKK